MVIIGIVLDPVQSDGCKQHGVRDGKGITNGQEDCLLLNIYVPESVINQIDNTKVPVMVWIHGGGYVTGDSRMYTGLEHALTQEIFDIF